MRTPKAGDTPALRPRAHGINGAPVCDRLKAYLSATPAKSAETERTRSASRHTQSRSQTGAPIARPGGAPEGRLTIARPLQCRVWAATMCPESRRDD